jgi:hypothetical protein
MESWKLKLKGGLNKIKGKQNKPMAFLPMIV